MSNQSRLVSLVCTLALLAVFIPAAVVGATDNPRACRVRNLDTGTTTQGLRPALRDAAPGATLRVRGTCWGSFVIRKPVRIIGSRAGSPSGPSRIRGRSGRAALIIAPRVDAFTVAAGVRVMGGVVIAPPGSSQAKATLARTPTNPWRAGVRVDFVRQCRPVGHDGNLRTAVASGHTDIAFFGKCWGRLRIDEPMRITGERYFASSMDLATGKVHRSDSGKPMVRSKVKPSIVIDNAVDALVLQAFVVRHGLRVGAGVK